jgi:hypothetical protein
MWEKYTDYWISFPRKFTTIYIMYGSHTANNSQKYIHGQLYIQTGSSPTDAIGCMTYVISHTDKFSKQLQHFVWIIIKQSLLLHSNLDNKCTVYLCQSLHIYSCDELIVNEHSLCSFYIEQNLFLVENNIRRKTSYDKWVHKFHLKMLMLSTRSYYNIKIMVHGAL